MGLRARIARLLQRGTKRQSRAQRGELKGPRICRFEAMESRRLLAADPLRVGAVFIEEDLGSDLHGDTFEVSFEGGAPGTQLTRLVISGDQQQPGFGPGDVFFDTQESGFGADHAFPFQIVSFSSQDPQASVKATVADGGTELVLDLVGFRAGDKLVFSIDVDEVEDFDPLETDQTLINEGFDPLTSGVEFQGSRLTASFSAAHFFHIADSTEFRNRYDDLLDPLQLDLTRDDQGGKRDRTDGAGLTLTQEALPVSIAGTVYLDSNLNLSQDPGESGLAHVELLLFQRSGNEFVFTGHKTTTDAQGSYNFGTSLDLKPGTYQVRETQPAGLFSVGAIPGSVAGNTTGGSPAGNRDLLTDITIPWGDQHAIDYDFAETQPASISGFVYHDRSDDGARGPGEEGLGGVEIHVIPVETIVPQGTVKLTTGPDGSYIATGLAPGSYRIMQPNQPSGFFDGKDAAGTVAGGGVGTANNPGDSLQGIFLAGGQAGVEYNFGEIAPASIGGHVHLTDADGNCFVPGVSDRPLSGVTLRLLDADGTLLAETKTNANGQYEFRDLLPGEYTLVQVTPAELIDGGEHVGSIGGRTVGRVSANDVISGIVLGSGQVGEHYDFCEHEAASLSGFVYHDQNNNGSFDLGEDPISQVQITLQDKGGQVVATTVSGPDGSYAFGGLRAGEYTLIETHPGGWLDGLDAAGQIGGATVGTVGSDHISGIALRWGDQGTRYDFGELLPASISGHVHLTDADGNCFGPGSDATGIPNVLVTLRNASGATVAETRTDANGGYSFSNLRPGTYAVVEHTPVGLLDGAQHLGRIDNRTVGHVSENDVIAGIALSSGDQAVGYDFCEHEPSSLSGNVYHDENDNGLLEPGETGIGGVTVDLRDASGATVASTLTTPDGAYHFADLAAGNYTIIEHHPGGWTDGRETLGTINGRIVGTRGNDQFSNVALRWGEDGLEYNFGEFHTSSIAGVVHADLDLDCEVDPGETLLAGVTIELLDANGQVLTTTQTDGDGQYGFDGLTPGIYSVRERQPDGYFHGGQSLGTGNGDGTAQDVLAGISVGSGVHLEGYDFCEHPPASLSGFVFQDGETLVTEDGLPPVDLAAIRDGQFTPDDTPIAGVVLELRDGRTGLPIDASHALPGTYPAGPVRATTNGDGYYEFAGLLGGREYAVYQVHPEGFFDGIDTPGTTSGQAFNVGQPIPQGTLQQLAEPPRNDAIVRIRLDMGAVSQSNNFSEVRVDAAPPPPQAPTPFIKPAAVSPQPLPDVNLPPLLISSPGPAGIVAPLTQVLGGGLASGGGSTWHLSVINAGMPRDLASADRGNTLWRQARFLNQTNWEATRLREAQWTLMVNEEADEGAEVRTYVFGVRGGVPVTGDFNGDGIDELAVFYQGEWFIDLNGNGVWDDEDLWAQLGNPHDMPVTGDWDGDGKDDIGTFGPQWTGDERAVEAEPGLPDVQNVGGARMTEHHVAIRAAKNLPPADNQATDGRRLLQLHQHGPRRLDVIDHVFRFGAGSDRPVAGDWNGDGIRTIGVFRDGKWKLDLDGDGRWTRHDVMFMFGEAGDLPVVGDFDGNGVEEIGVYRAGKWLIDSNGNRELDAHDKVFEMGAADDQPIVGDWNGDGSDQPGLYRDGYTEPQTPVSN